MGFSCARNKNLVAPTERSYDADKTLCEHYEILVAPTRKSHDVVFSQEVLYGAPNFFFQCEYFFSKFSDILDYFACKIP